MTAGSDALAVENAPGNEQMSASSNAQWKAVNHGLADCLSVAERSLDIVRPSISMQLAADPAETAETWA